MLEQEFLCFPEKLQMAFDLSRPLLQKILLQIFQKIWTFAFTASIPSTQKKKITPPPSPSAFEVFPEIHPFLGVEASLSCENEMLDPLLTSL